MEHTHNSDITILGIFAADLGFHGERLPVMGETLIGSKFGIGPGGKGSNQSVAAARAGGKVTFISRLGRDQFGDMARSMYKAEGITMLIGDSDLSTGAAFIFVDDKTGNNAIIVVPGSAGELRIRDIDANAEAIKGAKVFMTQLEQPIDVASHALHIAKSAGVITILNTAPAAPLADSIYKLCDYVTPNESEATMLTGISVTDVASATKAAEWFLKKGAGAALITLGGQGSLLHDGKAATNIPIFSAGKVIDTTGAGDAFNGGFAAALARGIDPVAAAHFGSATAGISVTRPGTAPSMPFRSETEALIAAN
jgi:ribokinase